MAERTNNNNNNNNNNNWQQQQQQILILHFYISKIAWQKKYRISISIDFKENIIILLNIAVPFGNV